MSRRPHSVVKFAVDAATSQIVEPPTHIRENGFATGTRPPAQWLNYLFRDLSLWVDRLRGPSRREWTRYEIAATELGMPAVDPVTNPEQLTAPARRMIVIKGTGGRVMASVRGTALTELTMVAGPDTAVLAACATNDGWLVGGAHAAITNGRIVGTTFDPDAGSAVKNPAVAWTVHTVPALMRAVYAIVARTSGPQAGDAVAVIDDAEILVRTGPTTWAYATTSLPLGGNGSDVCDTGEQWIFVDTSGIVFRSSWPSAVTFAAVSTFSGGGAWRLACDDRGTVVAYRAGESSPEDWYISTDHGLTWSDVSAPPYTRITRIRYVDGTWLLGSEDWPHVAESNDLVHWQACPVPHADGASMRINDFALLDGAIVAVGSNHWLRGARGELVAPGPWSPAGLSLATADAGYLQGRVIAATAPTSGQVLTWSSVNSRWEPASVGGGGGGTYASLTDVDVTGVANGHLPWYDAGASKWKTLAPGSARTPLVSQGPTTTPAYATDVVPLTQRIEDGVNAGVSVCATITHDLTGGVGADGIGARCVLRARNGSGAIADAGAIDGVLTTAAGGAEVGAIDVRARAGGSLAHVARLAASSATVLVPTTINVADAGTSTVLTGLTINRSTSGTAAAGIGTRILLQTEDAGGATEDAAAIDAVLTNAGAATEASAIDLHTRTGGAALRRVLRVWASGGLWVGSQATPYDGGDGTITLPNVGGYCLETGGTIYQVFGRFGGSNLTIGSGAFATNLNAFTLAISAGQGTTITNGYLDLSCGFRRRRTAVANANHTVTSAQSVIDVTGLTAARTVTLPAFADGLIVTITNSDGSADGTRTISVVASSGTNNINGVTTYVAIDAPYGSVTLYCNSATSRWTVIAKV